MRKPQSFSVFSNGKTVTIQSDKSIGEFSIETGAGVFNPKGCYFVHLNPILGAKPMQLTPEQLALIMEFALKPGDEIGPGVRLA